LSPSRVRASASTSGSIAAAMPELTGPVAPRPWWRRPPRRHGPGHERLARGNLVAGIRFGVRSHGPQRIIGLERHGHGTDERAEQRRLWARPGRTWSVASVNDPMPRAGSSQNHAACPRKITAGRPAMTRGNPFTVRTAKKPRVSGQLEGQRRPRPGRKQDACLRSVPDASTRRTQQGREPLHALWPERLPDEPRKSFLSRTRPRLLAVENVPSASSCRTRWSFLAGYSSI
jgi:hypothetical protein